MRFIKPTATSLICISLKVSAAWSESTLPKLDVPAPNLSRDYCSAFVKEAETARQSRQKMELDALNDKLDKKLAEINEKTATLEKWVTHREAILAEATTSILKIYDVMDPVFAAQELSKLDVITVSAILRKMKPKKSSDILKEMEPLMAARIVGTISAEANLKREQIN
jgi:flagellar motility protein MotE (MotC chaperone)